MTPPLVSVVIDTFNHERFIAHAVESVLGQRGMRPDEFEVIVVDDGSSDSTADRLRGYSNRIAVIHKPNGGQASAFNAGIARCTADIICFLDGDDYWHPDKLQRVVRVLAENPQAMAVGHGIIEVDEKGNELRRVGPAQQASLRCGEGKN